MTDRYTQAALTVIAAALIALVVSEYHQGWGARWVNIDYSGDLNVQNKEMYPLYVKIVQ